MPPFLAFNSETDISSLEEKTAVTNLTTGVMLYIGMFENLTENKENMSLADRPNRPALREVSCAFPGWLEFQKLFHKLDKKSSSPWRAQAGCAS